MVETFFLASKVGLDVMVGNHYFLTGQEEGTVVRRVMNSKFALFREAWKVEFHSKTSGNTETL